MAAVNLPPTDGTGSDIGNSFHGENLFSPSNGVWYAFTRQAGGGIGVGVGDGKIHALKSINAGVTWNEMDSANAPGPADFKRSVTNGKYTILRDGNIVLVLMELFDATPAPTFLSLYNFDLLTDTWSGPTNFGTPLPDWMRFGGIDAGHSTSFQLVLVSAGNYLLFYSGPREANNGRCYVATFNGAVFGASVALPEEAGSPTYFFPVDCKVDSTGKEHYIILDGTSIAGHGFGFTVRHITRSASIFSASDIITSLGDFSSVPRSFSQLCIYTIGGIETLAIAGDVFDDAIALNQQEALFTSPASAPSWTKTLITADPAQLMEDVEFYVEFIGITLISSGTFLYFLWCKTVPSGGGEAQFWTCKVPKASLIPGIVSKLWGDSTFAKSSACQVIGASGSVGFLGISADQNTDEELSQFFAIIATPPTCNLTASSGSVTPGGAVTLSWTTTNTPTNASINNGVGTVPPLAGSVVVRPSATTTYILTVSNADGNSTCQTTVNVVENCACPDDVPFAKLGFD